MAFEAGGLSHAREEAAARQQQCAAPGMAFKAGESAHAREEAVARQQQRPSWVVLSTIPVVVLRAEDEHEKKTVADGDLVLDLQQLPRPTYLHVPKRLALGPSWPPHPLPTIAAAEPSARLLFSTCQEEGICDAVYFLFDADTQSAARLPPVPADFGAHFHPRRRSVGLAANPHRLGHFVVAQLHPPSASRFEKLLYFCTATMEWGTKALASSPHHKPWGSHGVLVHGGLLWWVDAARGILVCDPFLKHPHLRLVPLPDGCEIMEPVRCRSLLDKRRIVRLSDGKLRYVEICGLPYNPAADDIGHDPGVWIWTLVDQDCPPHWSLDYNASFAEIWADESYIDAGLTPGNVPTLALLDPTNHAVVYFFEGESIFGLDVRAGRIIACEHGCFMDPSHPDQRKFQFSRFVDALKLPQRFHKPSSDGNTVGKLEGLKENLVYIGGPNPLTHMRARHPQISQLEAEESSSPREPKAGFKDGLTNIRQKIQRETNQSALSKLLREEAFLQGTLEALALDDEEQD